MILKTRNGDVRFAMFDSSTPVPRPSQYGGQWSYAGRRVTMQDAAGLPAFMRGVRLLAETTAMMPAMAFRGFGDERKPQPSAPQMRLLHRPNPDMTRFQVWSYTVTAMLRGNAFLWKQKGPRGVDALYPLDPSLVTIKYEKGELEFEVRERELGPVKLRVGRELIVHLPGILLTHPCIGLGVIEAYRHGLGTYLARQEFEARYLANDGHPGVVLKHPGNTTNEQREQIRSSYEYRHQGPANAGRPALMWGGWDIDRLAVSLDDAQFIESQQFTVQEIGRMLGVPAGLLGDPNAPGNESVEQENMRFLTYGLDPWMTRLEQGLAADTDLFPDADWSVELDPKDLLKADIKTRYEAYRLARQGGWLAPNEIRAVEGREPKDGGDDIQITPVGGAPNASGAPRPEVEATAMHPEAHLHMHVDEGAVQFTSHAPNVEVQPPAVTVNTPDINVHNVIEPGGVVLGGGNQGGTQHLVRGDEGLIAWVGNRRVVRDEYGRPVRLEES